MTDPKSDKATDALKIAELAARSQLEYDRVRVVEAEALGCRVTTLDEMVGRARCGQR